MEAMMTGHHLILGDLTDAITGELLEDSHDERYRQKIARILLSDKGFSRAAITPRIPLTVAAGNRRGRIRVDFLVAVDGRSAMIVKYGPGSLITRHRPALAGPKTARWCCRSHPPWSCSTHALRPSRRGQSPNWP